MSFKSPRTTDEYAMINGDVYKMHTPIIKQIEFVVTEESRAFVKAVVDARKEKNK